MNNLTRKDTIGNIIQIGDTVVYNPPYYKGIEIGTITSFSPKQVYVDGTKITTGVVKVARPSNLGDTNEEHY